jgi:hypothetical protein
MNPAFAGACTPYLAALGHLGHSQVAARVRQRLLAIDPGFAVRRFIEASPLTRPEDREYYATGLRLAGLPE